MAIARPARELLSDLSDLDQSLYRTIAGAPMPVLDRPLRTLSDAANGSRLWVTLALGLALFGGRQGRRAASAGLLSIAVASPVVNLGLKAIGRRPRPARLRVVPPTRWVKMPSSGSFPSGHAASGFAFAAGASSRAPALAVPLHGLAAAVAYSRVYTGVHYPGDALAGSIAGDAIGRMVTGALARRHRRPFGG